MENGQFFAIITIQIIQLVIIIIHFILDIRWNKKKQVIQQTVHHDVQENPEIVHYKPQKKIKVESPKIIKPKEKEEEEILKLNFELGQKILCPKCEHDKFKKSFVKNNSQKMSCKKCQTIIEARFIQP